jgi:hypothetical protein
MNLVSCVFQINSALEKVYPDTNCITYTFRDRRLATDPEALVRFPALPDSLGKKRKTVVCLERGPLNLVSTTEELLDRKVAAPV